MSFRHTYITEFLYKYGEDDELSTISAALSKYGSVNWNGKENLGYFFGVIKDLNGYDTKNNEQQIIEDIEKAGARIKIVFE